MRILIADDEAFARAELRELLGQLPLPPDTQIATAADGVEALESALENPPDLLITDVRMPRMDGIALARQTAQSFPGCRMIFLSNYSDKPYLRAAIQLHAVEYIDKPVEEETFRRAVEQALTELKNAQDARESLSRTCAQARALLLQRWTSVLCSRHSDPDALRSQAEQYGLGEWYTAAYRCMLYRVTDDAGIPEPVPERARALPLQLQGDGIAVRFLYARDARDLDDDVMRSLWAQSGAGTGVLGAAVGGVAEDCRTAYRSYEEAVRALNRLFFRKRPTLEFASGETAGETMMLDDRAAAALEAPLLEMDADEAGRVLDGLFARLRRNPDTPTAQIRSCCCGIADRVLRISLANHLDFHELHTSAELYRSIWEAKSFDAVEQTVGGWIRELLTCGYAEERSVRLTVAYIRRHYGDRELDLGKICDFVGYSASSLCPLFKKTMGMTINAFITETRMEQARELLLNTGDSLEQIAAACGYAGPKYFGRIFKSRENMSPGEFRRRGRVHVAVIPTDDQTV